MSRRPKSKQTMSFRDAVALVPDNLPDGAFWAMAHEFAGLEYGDGFAELDAIGENIYCKKCHKTFGSSGALANHNKVKHP